jgi:hypothetical protein
MRSRHNRQKGGNDPAFGCRAPANALVVRSFPPFGCREWSTAGSKPDQLGISRVIEFRYAQGR